MYTQYIIDMLEDMFSEGPLVDPDELATSDVKKQQEEALQAKKEVAEAAGEHDPSATTKFVVIHALLIPLEYGFNPDLYPAINLVTELSTKKPGTQVTKFYYKCNICGHQAQNCASMFTHTRKCLNIKLECPVCSKKYDSHDHINNHITTVHDGKCDPAVISKTKAEGIVASMCTK